MFKNNRWYHACEPSRPPAEKTGMFKVMNSTGDEDYENYMYTLF